MKEVKKCTKCNNVLTLNFFSKRTKSLDGLAASCKKCVNQYKKEYYLNNQDKIKEWKEDNRDKVLNHKKNWYLKYKDTAIKEYKEKNEDKIKEYRHFYGPLYEKKRRKNDIKFKLRMNVGCLVRARLRTRLLKKGKSSISTYLPYTIDELILHLENLFLPGMNWENYGQWHIDHKKPDILFNYSNINDKEFQRCWALDNLQPLWAIDNVKKGKRYGIIVKAGKPV